MQNRHQIPKVQIEKKKKKSKAKYGINNLILVTGWNNTILDILDYNKLLKITSSIFFTFLMWFLENFTFQMRLTFYDTALSLTFPSKKVIPQEQHCRVPRNCTDSLSLAARVPTPPLYPIKCHTQLWKHWVSQNQIDSSVSDFSEPLPGSCALWASNKGCI